MNIVFIGCVEFSAATLRHVLDARLGTVVGVVTRRASPFNADFVSLEGAASSAGIPSFVAEGNDQAAMAEWIAARHPDVIFCFGWSYLLKPGILGLARLGVVGYHPAALPQNRGRHPITWALALGLGRTASTFFFMDDGADSGDILSQRFLEILPSDDAGTLYRRLIAVSLLQLNEFTAQLASGHFPRTPQDHSQANVWRKRGKRDGEVDWRMSAQSIHNLVRALGRPYVGAHCLWAGNEIKIWRTRPADGRGFENCEPGKVLGHDRSAPIVKCGQDAIVVDEHEFPALPAVGSYL
ncbi:MAG TPA: formyltransferase family protein [Polyangia bacterium]|nr:formyltransferase family protein [Polyangia bacterium]